MKVVLLENEEIEVEGLDLEVEIVSNDRVIVKSVPDSFPPPLDGDIFFESTLEPEDFVLWNCDDEVSNGNTKTHPLPGQDPIPVPAIVGTRSLRVKYASGLPSGGLVPPGETVFADRLFSNLAPGNWYLDLWRVAHDDGTYIVRLFDGFVALEVEGTEHLVEYEWRKDSIPFSLSGTTAHVQIEYTAPPLNKSSGVKLGYLCGRRV